MSLGAKEDTRWLVIADKDAATSAGRGIDAAVGGSPGLLRILVCSHACVKFQTRMVA